MLIRRSAQRAGRAAIIAVAVLALWPILADAIMVAPHAVFMSHRTRTGQMYLVNTGTEPEEVAIELKFGYPDSDSLGGVYIHYFDNPTPDQHSAAEWIRAFPRRVVVAPGVQQVVRLLATPPADLPDGEYWSRIVVTSHGAPVAVAGGDSAVHAQITFEVKTIASLIYRKGDVHTGLLLNDFRSTLTRDSLVVWLDLAHTGNAAYVGNIRLGLRDNQGQYSAQWDTPIAVYVPQHRRFAFPVGPLGPGAYTVRLAITTTREDVPSENILQAPPLERSMGVEVPVR